MNFLVIPDKFKGSLTSAAVANAFADGVKKVKLDAKFKFIAASDGGDGFIDAVSNYKNCIALQVIAENPLGKPIQSYYLYNQKDSAAYIEMAKTAGMVLLSAEERNPMQTSTLGTGLQIKDAIEKGVRNIYIGLGGSATNDGGIGIAHSLGYRFLDSEGNILHPVGKNLIHINKIDDTLVSSLLNEVSFYAVNDVTNPLYGDNGAAFVYAAQKGADEKMIQHLDAGLRNLDKVVSSHYKKEYSKTSGSGAAGGTAYGLKCFLNAEYISGIDFILGLAGIHDLLSRESFDMIVTGEGKIDEQTLNGKLMDGVLQLATAYKIPVLAICGALDVSLDVLENKGVHSVIEIQDTSKNLDYNMRNAAQLLTNKTAKYFQFLDE